MAAKKRLEMAKETFLRKDNFFLLTTPITFLCIPKQLLQKLPP